MSHTYEMVNRIGESLIKLLVTINGGAAIAVLGFAGSILSGNGSIAGPYLGRALAIYAVGVFLAALSLGFMNLFLMADAEPDWQGTRLAKCTKLFRRSAYATGSLSMLAFLTGSLAAACAITP